VIDIFIPRCYRKRIAFLCNLASVAKWQSFCRAGLVGLAECIASAASGSNGEAKWHEDAFLDMAEVEISSESFPHHDKTILLDVLRFVIESSKQHFNPNYRFRGL
jgi:tRNA guanosine-2'-O-methyltransferase